MPSKERIILDTDVGGDIDDAGAMAVMHALADRDEIEILAVMIVNGHELAVPYTQAINAWYGRSDIPIGMIKRDAPFSRDEYMAPIVAAYPHTLTSEVAPDAVPLYRRILAAQPDRSVTLVVIGPATNISHLLNTGPDEFSPLSGVELVRRKIKFYAAGGNGDGELPKGRPGFNYHMDRAAARDEMAKMPEDFPTVFAGGSGNQLKIGNCYAQAAPDHIVRRSYEAYFHGKADMDRPTWDQLRMLYAARPESRRRFETSPPGDIQLDENNVLTWTPAPNRNRAYASVRDFDAVREEVTTLMMHVR